METNDTKMKKLWKEILQWVIVIIITIAVVFVINRFVIYKVSSPTESMENTIMIGDKVYTYRLAYLFGDPERGDIVVFEFPDDPSQDYLKRVIGLPGDKVEVIDGVVHINDEPLEEDYLKEDPEGDFGPVTVPEGKYFMMGDNRNVSFDSREWENKFVAKDKIIGKAIFKYPDFKWF